MATLDEVLSQLHSDEPPADIDFNAPEPGSFPPPFKPSPQRFVFRLPEQADQQFEVVPIRGAKHLQVNFIAEVTLPDGSVRKVTFQRANTYKTDKMDNSSVGNLIRSLQLREAYEANLANTSSVSEAIVRTLQEADGRAAGLADFGWTAAFKDSLVVYRTGASKKRTSTKADGSPGYTTLPWPRNGSGEYVETVADPASGQEKYGNLEIVRFRVAKQASP